MDEEVWREMGIYQREMMKWFNKRVKRMDALDVGLVKWSVLTFTLFVVSISPTVMNWVQSTNPWYFLIAFLVLVARPLYRVYIK